MCIVHGLLVLNIIHGNKQVKDLATVITNLMSAIPWVGQDIVESNNGTYTYLTATMMSALPILGTVHKNAIKKWGSIHKPDDIQSLSIPSSFIAFFAGLVDGDGYIQITKTSKGFIAMKLVISLHLEDISTLEYIRSVYKLGKIDIYRDNRSPTCKLVINRTDLQRFVFPLFIYHGIYFLTETRIKQFDLAIYILKQDIKIFDDIASGSIPNTFKLPSTPLGYNELPFFKNWIVGFTTSEGSFFIKSNNDGCFQLKQRIHVNLFEAFKLVFNTTRKIETEKNLYNQFGVSSKADIQKVLDFFSFSGLHPLIGLKGIQYMKWLNSLHDNKLYKVLNFPKTVL